MPEKQSSVVSQKDQKDQKDQQVARRQPAAVNPLRMFDRFADEMDRMFSEFGLGRGWGRASTTDLTTWTPQIEIWQRNNELVVHADLPGMKTEDVRVDVTDDAIVIQGERNREHEEDRGGVYRSERSYGSFYRAIPVPEGAITDQAKASFKDGVLEITMPAPPEQVTNGRRLEINDAETKSK
jgi:HSP20 family protein